MRYTKLVIILCLIALINACACAPPHYNKNLAISSAYTRLNANTVAVSFFEERPTYRENLETDLLYSCAFVTTHLGYDYFIIIGGDLSDYQRGDTVHDGQSKATVIIQMFKKPRPPNLWYAFDARQLTNNSRSPG